MLAKEYNLSKSKAEEIYGAAIELVPVLPKNELTKLIVFGGLYVVPYFFNLQFTIDFLFAGY